MKLKKKTGIGKSTPNADLQLESTANLHKPPRGKRSQLNVLFPDEKLLDVKICSAMRGITMSRLLELVWDEWRARNP